MNKLHILSELDKSVDEFIQQNKCSRRGRVECYLQQAMSVGVTKEEIDVPKSQRSPDGQQLSLDEIKKFILGNTLRRPCFDMYFDLDGQIYATWNDGLWDTKGEIATQIRRDLSLENPLDVSYAVPVGHVGKWSFTQSGPAGIFRTFDFYSKPFLTEFFYQKNGLLNVKGHNDTDIIWYDVLVLKGNQLPKKIVQWKDLSPHTDVQMNLHWEKVYNSGPQQRTY